MKQCSVCNTIKEESEFFVRSNRKSGRTSACKKCAVIKRRDYYARNKETVLNINRKSWHKNRDKNIEINKAWKADNKDKVLEYKRQHNTKRRNTFSGKIRDRITTGLRRVLKGGKSDKTFNLLPYTPEQASDYLLNTMPSGYSIKDFIDGKLHIDHVRPVSSFNITDDRCVDFQKCWELKNLQLLPAYENLVKWKHFNVSEQRNMML